MRRTLALVVALTLGSAAAFSSRAQAEPVPGGVAVVDLLQLITAHPDYVRAKADLEARRARATEDSKAAEETLKKKIGEYEQMGNRDTPPARDLARQIESMRMTAEFQFKWAGKVAGEEYARALVAIYKQVVALVAQVARDNRIPVVLQMTNEDLKADSREEFVSNVIVRSVVHFDMTNNITDKVKALLPAASR